MNEHERGRIAAAMNQLRPDWPTRQLTTLLKDTALADRPRRDVAVALAWVACEAGTASPYRVLEGGPWWKAAGVEGNIAPRHEYDLTLSCDVCSRPEASHRPHDGHEFVSVLDAVRQERVSVDPDRMRELRTLARGLPRDCDDRNPHDD